MANKFKGTFDITLGGKEYTLRPSFDAVCEFEDVTGVTATKARQDLVEGTQGAKIIPAAIWAGIKGDHPISGQKVPTLRIIGETMRKEGVLSFHFDALKLLTYASSADDIIDRVENAEDEDKEDQKKSQPS